MLDKKDSQIDEMRSEINWLADKLCKAQSMLHDAM